jgi:hypothetical protein
LGWGLGIGVWGIAPNPQSPIPNPQSPIPNPQIIYLFKIQINNIKIKKYSYYFKVFSK